MMKEAYAQSIECEEPCEGRLSRTVLWEGEGETHSLYSTLYRFGFEIPNGCDAKYKSKKSREKKIGRPAKAKVVHEPKGW